MGMSSIDGLIIGHLTIRSFQLFFSIDERYFRLMISERILMHNTYKIPIARAYGHHDIITRYWLPRLMALIDEQARRSIDDLVTPVKNASATGALTVSFHFHYRLMSATPAMVTHKCLAI